MGQLNISLILISVVKLPVVGIHYHNGRERIFSSPLSNHWPSNLESCKTPDVSWWVFPLWETLVCLLSKCTFLAFFRTHSTCHPSPSTSTQVIYYIERDRLSRSRHLTETLNHHSFLRFLRAQVPFTQFTGNCNQLWQQNEISFPGGIYCKKEKKNQRRDIEIKSQIKVLERKEWNKPEKVQHKIGQKLDFEKYRKFPTLKITLGLYHLEE